MTAFKPDSARALKICAPQVRRPCGRAPRKTPSSKQRLPHLPKPVAIAILQPRRHCCGWSATLPCSRFLAALASRPKSASGMGRRPQRPGNQSRSRALLKLSPAIHPRELPAAAGSAAIIRQAQNITSSLVPLSITFPHAATRDSISFVQKLWTLRLPCGSMRKKQNELWIVRCLCNNFNHLYAEGDPGFADLAWGWGDWDDVPGVFGHGIGGNEIECACGVGFVTAACRETRLLYSI
jgi:hypothetical protein